MDLVGWLSISCSSLRRRAESSSLNSLPDFPELELLLELRLRGRLLLRPWLCPLVLDLDRGRLMLRPRLLALLRSGL